MNNVIQEPNYIIKIFKFAGRASGFIGIVTILSYITGFVIINSYLGKYGLTAGELFGAKYLSAGLLYLAITVIFIVNWWFFIKSYYIMAECKTFREKIKYIAYPIVLIISTLIFLIVIFSPSKHTGDMIDKFFQKNWTQYLFLILLVIFAITRVLGWFFKTSKNRLENWGMFFLVILMFVFILQKASVFFFLWVIFLFCLLSLIFGRKKTNEPFSPILIDSLGKRYINPIGFASTLVLTFSMIWFFGRMIYERITPDIGGGSPVKVKILLRESLPSSFSTVIKDTSNADVIEEAYLLHQEQSSLVLLIPDSIGGDKAIRLNYNEVRLMIPIIETNVRPKKVKNPNQQR